MAKTIPFLRGQTATVDLLNAAILAATMPGLKKTVTFTVSGKNVSVSSHIGVFGTGVSVIETEDTVLDTTKFFTTGQQAFNGTLCYILDPSLYRQPELVIRTGITQANADEFVFVVGWVRYPGSNIALSPKHFTSAPVASPAFSIPLGDKAGYLSFDPDTNKYSWEPVGLVGDHKVMSTAKDPKAGYIEDKIESTDTIDLSVNPVTRKLAAKLTASFPKVTVSTTAPTGTPKDGEIWLQVAEM